MYKMCGRTGDQPHISVNSGTRIPAAVGQMIFIAYQKFIAALSQQIRDIYNKFGVSVFPGKDLFFVEKYGSIHINSFKHQPNLILAGIRKFFFCKDFFIAAYRFFIEVLRVVDHPVVRNIHRRPIRGLVNIIHRCM